MRHLDISWLGLKYLSIQYIQYDAVDSAIKVEEKQEITQSTFMTQEEKLDTVVTRRVTRSVSKAQHEIVQQQVAEIKKSADAKEEKQQMEKLTQQSWSCQILASLAICLIPIMLMGLYFVAGSKQQSFSFTKWPEIPSIYALFNWKVAVALGIWYDLQFLLTKLPLGQVLQ